MSHFFLRHPQVKVGGWGEPSDLAVDPHSFWSVDPDLSRYKMKGKAEFNHRRNLYFSSLNLKNSKSLRFRSYFDGLGTDLEIDFFLDFLKMV